MNPRQTNNNLLLLEFFLLIFTNSQNKKLIQAQSLMDRFEAPMLNDDVILHSFVPWSHMIMSLFVVLL